MVSLRSQIKNGNVFRNSSLSSEPLSDRILIFLDNLTMKLNHYQEFNKLRICRQGLLWLLLWDCNKNVNSTQKKKEEGEESARA